MRGWFRERSKLARRNPLSLVTIFLGSTAGYIKAWFDVVYLFDKYDMLLVGLIGMFVILLVASYFALAKVTKIGRSPKGIMRALVGLLISFVFGILVSQAWGAFVRSQGSVIKITLPKRGESVAHQQPVSGTVLNPTTDVWVVVHPMASSSFFVQPRVGVRSDRTWSVYAFFGAGPNVDSTEEFEVGAFANPKVSLADGQVLSDWPESESRDIVGVEKR